MYFVKKLMKLRVRCCLLHGRGAHETSPVRESVVVSRMVCCLHAHLSVSESITPRVARMALGRQTGALHGLRLDHALVRFHLSAREEVSPPRLEFGPLGSDA